MHITAQGPRLQNDLYCVEWDVKRYYTIPYDTVLYTFVFKIVGEVFDYLVAHGRMKEKEARSKFRQVSLQGSVGNCYKVLTFFDCYFCKKIYKKV